MNNEVTKNQPLKDGIIDFIAGSLGGIALVYTGQPLDTVKVKLQTFPNLYKNMFQCFNDTYHKEGIVRGLYAGTIPAVAANVAENSVLFAAYGGCQKFIKLITNTNSSENLSVLGNACAGFLAAFFSSFTLCPTELIKCKLQAAREVQMTKGYTVGRGVREAIKDFQPERSSAIDVKIPGVIRRDSAKAFTHLSIVEPIGSTPLHAINSKGCFQYNKFELYRNDITTPDDQQEEAKAEVRLSPFKVTQQVIREEGYRGLFRGLGSTMAREMPGYFVFFGSYELTKTLLKPKNYEIQRTAPIVTMISGAVGGIAFWIAVFPADVVKSRLQVSNLEGNLFQLMLQIKRQEGIMALYSGLSPTLLRTIPSTAVLFLTFETTRIFLHSWLDAENFPSKIKNV